LLAVLCIALTVNDSAFHNVIDFAFGRLRYCNDVHHVLQLVGMNVGWQTAHSHQEQHIAELEETNRQLKLQLQSMSVAGTVGLLTEQQQADIDRVLLEQRHKYDALEENCRQVNSVTRTQFSFCVMCSYFVSSVYV
jgi:hypothetical protein